MKEKEAQEKRDADTKDLSKVASKQAMLQTKIQEATSKIQELGSLPSPEMVNKYMSYSSKNVSETITHDVDIFLLITLHDV